MRRIVIGGVPPWKPRNQTYLAVHLTDDRGEQGTALCGRVWIDKPGWKHSAYPAPPDNRSCVTCWRVDQGFLTPSPTALASRVRRTNCSAKPADNKKEA